MISKIAVKLLLFFLAVLCALLPLLAGDAAKAEPAARAPVIDGKLDDPAWVRALVWSGFRTTKPDFGGEPTEKTDLLFTYDARHLYFAFRCADSRPGRIQAAMAQRDGIAHDDTVGLLLDLSGTQQSGYAFFVNPLGIQMDGIITPAGEIDAGFDTVWHSAGLLTDAGYNIEISIPLKSLRFPNGKELAFGIMATRTIVRKSEEMCVPAYNPKDGPVLSQLGQVRVSGLTYERTIEGLPALTFSQGRSRQGGLWDPAVRQTDLSLTAKLGLTSDLILDAAANPDFSQVETDAGQIDINLRNALYYPEKRPFFLEGLENFEFGGALEQNPLKAVVHTRTIVDPSLGFKLTGKIGGRDQISSIFALDEPAAALGGPGADPSALFTLVRYKRLFSQDAYLGGFFTRRGQGGRSNILGGLDGRLRLAKSAALEYFAFNTWTDGGTAGGVKRGEAVGVKFAYASRAVSVSLGAFDIGKDFSVQTGYVTRTGVRMLAGLLDYMIYPKSKLVQRIDPYYYFTQTLDVPSGLFESQNYFALRIVLPRQTMIRIMGILANEVYAGARFRRDGYWVTAGSQITKELALQLNLMDTKAVYYDPSAPCQGDGLQLSAALQYQPTEQLRTELACSTSNFYRASDGAELFDYTILRNKTTFQVNRYLFFRGIFEYNMFRKRWTADLLTSFTYIPGTVLHLGYGSVYEKIRWNSEDGGDRPDSDFLQTRKAFFFKASYLWRF